MNILSGTLRTITNFDVIGKICVGDSATYKIEDGKWILTPFTPGKDPFPWGEPVAHIASVSDDALIVKTYQIGAKPKQV